ncbi:MAG TPA: Ig-like domain-containing protein [Gemmatimonadales bacterium]|nr:Ig-like domain-containing protein [Gemmatimonadales bacterium]
MKRNVMLVGLLSLLLSGCGFLISKGPPTGHEQMLSFSCTESNAGPTLDIVWAALNVLGAAAAASQPDAYDNAGQIVAVGIGWGVVSSFSAASGYKKSKECRQALQQLAQRNAERTGAVSGIVVPDNGTVVAVVVSPSDDTLAVGAQLQLVAEAHGSSGAVIVNRPFTWSSSNDAVASVSNAGLVSAHAAGAVVIAANTNNVVGTVRVVVITPR